MASAEWETVGSIRERHRWIYDDLPDDLPARVVLIAEVLAHGVAPHIEHRPDLSDHGDERG